MTEAPKQRVELTAPRRDGRSALQWDKEARALKTFDPNPSKVVWDRTQKRPAGSNAEEWQLFLSEYLESRPATPAALTYVAVQIAEAIEAAANKPPCGECHLKPGETCDICRKQGQALLTIADIAEGSGTVNSLPHIAKVARGACACLQPGGNPLGNCEACAGDGVQQPDGGGCERCNGTGKSLNQEAKEHPPFDNPRDPYASPDRVPPEYPREKS
jgi:hypothetical protein